MNPEMKEFYVTFGQKYEYEPHPKVDYAHPDGWLTIEAENYAQARQKAFDELGPAWSMLYEEPLDLRVFGKGELHRI